MRRGDGLKKGGCILYIFFGLTGSRKSDRAVIEFSRAREGETDKKCSGDLKSTDKRGALN